MGQKTSSGEKTAASASGKTSGMAIASLVLGIVGLIFSWVPLLGWVAVILAIVLGFLSLRKINKDKSLKGKGFAIAGIVLGFITLALSVLILLAGVLFYTALMSGGYVPITPTG